MTWCSGAVRREVTHPGDGAAHGARSLGVVRSGGHITTVRARRRRRWRPPGFSTVSYNTTLGSYALTNFVFLPNGSSLIATGKCGYLVRVNLSADGTAASVTSMGQMPNPTPNMGPGVFCESDRGLVGIDLAPDYAVTGNIYLLFDYCKGGTGGPSVCNAPGKPTGKLSRFTVNNVNAPTALVPNSEKVVLDDMPSYSANPDARCDGSHTVGTVVVAPDGTLYVGNGEGSNYCDPDWSALLAQDVTSPRGKIFHIDADGNGVTDNPFYDEANPSSWQSRVFAYGFRNPFRFAIQPNTSNLMVGEVGWNTTEELDLVQKGKNYGWPCWEGNDKTGGYTDLDTCKTLYANGGDQKPLYTWPHAGSGSAAVGGAFYTGGDYPASYNGTFFFADYAKQWLSTRSAGGTVAMFGSRRLGRRRRHPHRSQRRHLPRQPARLHHRPAALHAGAEPVPDRPRPRQRHRRPGAAGRHLHQHRLDRPDGTIQSYQWDFGDGSPVVSGATATHTYTAAGVFTAKLTVRDNDNASSVDTDQHRHQQLTAGADGAAAAGGRHLRRGRHRVRRGRRPPTPTAARRPPSPTSRCCTTARSRGAATSTRAARPAHRRGRSPASSTTTVTTPTSRSW